MKNQGDGMLPVHDLWQRIRSLKEIEAIVCAWGPDKFSGKAYSGTGRRNALIDNCSCSCLSVFRKRSHYLFIIERWTNNIREVPSEKTSSNKIRSSRHDALLSFQSINCCSVPWERRAPNAFNPQFPIWKPDAEAESRVPGMKMNRDRGARECPVEIS